MGEMRTEIPDLQASLMKAMTEVGDDESYWPTGEMVDAIVQAVRDHDDYARPKVDVMRADPDGGDPDRWLVQIDTTPVTGRITIYLNDGDPLFEGDPEVDEP